MNWNKFNSCYSCIYKGYLGRETIPRCYHPACIQEWGCGAKVTDPDTCCSSYVSDTSLSRRIFKLKRVLSGREHRNVTV